MDEEASLTDFLDAGESAGDRTESSEPASAVEPATTTYAFTPGEGVCAVCETPAERRWQQDGDLVCPACKDW